MHEKQYSRTQLNVVGILSLLLAVGIGLYIIFQISSVSSETCVEGTFEYYETITTPVPHRGSQKYQKHNIVVSSKTYSINAPEYRYFRINEFSQNVQQGDQIILHIDGDEDIIGVEDKGNVYLSVSDSQKAKFLDYTTGWLVSALFALCSAFFLLYANHENFQNRVNRLSDQLEYRWRHWKSKQKRRH